MIHTIKNIILVLILMVNFSYAELVLIVHKDSPIKHISVKHLQKIYENKSKTWAHGGSIIRTSLRKGENHRNFCNILGKNTTQLKRFWKKQVFTGRGPSLKTYSSQKSLIEYISTHENSLGYVDSSIDTSLVKVIKIQRVLP
ncbi:MAG: hypothetical protein COB02_16675 [Candidatus Cloacimonadota bacterium]|nr:MAG: hypothetical protein COB02_16675 [Candidatus Cloacimonadota bacterium]